MIENKVGFKEIHEKLWEARNEEIKHLWQRSVILATFLTVLITVYLAFAGSVLEASFPCKSEQDGIMICISISSCSDDCNDWLNLLILDFLSIAGFAFSVLWICMARGSKLSYERIERGINLAYDGGFWDEDMEPAISKDFIDNLWNFGDHNYIPMHGSLPDPDYSFRFFSVEGSKLSLSKINILIGYIFLFVWMLSVIINPFIAGASSWWFYIISYLVSAAFMILFALFLFRKATSDGYNDSRLLKLLKDAEKASPFVSGNLKNEYIEWVIVSGDEEVRKHIKAVFKNYNARCGYKLTHSLIDRLLALLDSPSDTNELETVIKAFENDSFLRNMLETAIMYRTKIPAAFQHVWIGPDIHIEINNDKSFFSLRNGEDPDDLTVVPSSEVRTENTVHLFADNMWSRIESIKENNESGFKDAFDNSSVIYLLGEKIDGSRFCIKLSFLDSLYSDITATKGSKMNVEFSCIDGAKKLSTSSYIVNKVED